MKRVYCNRLKPCYRRLIVSGVEGKVGDQLTRDAVPADQGRNDIQQG